MGLNIGLQNGLPIVIKCKCCDKELRLKPFKHNTNGHFTDSFPPNIRLYIEGDKEMEIFFKNKLKGLESERTTVED